MSNVLLTAHWKAKLPSSAKFVLIALCDAANQHDQTWIAIKSKTVGRDCLMLRTSYSKTTIIGAMNKLEELGYILRTRRTGSSSIIQVLRRPVLVPQGGALTCPGGKPAGLNPLHNQYGYESGQQEDVDKCPICGVRLPGQIRLEQWNDFLSIREQTVGLTSKIAAKSILQDLQYIQNECLDASRGLDLCIRNVWPDVDREKLIRRLTPS